MKQRTEKEGRALVAEYQASGKTRRRFAEDTGVSFSALQYWLKRVRTLDGEDVANGFVEIDLSKSAGNGAVQIEWGELRVSFSQMPDARWLNSFIQLMTS